jgi:ribosomal protein S18 acetylase RimI-like enzyme
MEIRFAKAQDVSGIIKLLQQVGRVHHEGRPDIFRGDAQKYGPSQVIALLDKPGSPIFVAVEDDAVLGYCFCQLKIHEKDPVLCDRTELYIDDLCVDENHRGQRIGKALYEAACRYAKQRGCYNITLNVWSCNENAEKFYKALGVQPQKTTMEQIL